MFTTEDQPASVYGTIYKCASQGIAAGPSAGKNSSLLLGTQGLAGRDIALIDCHEWARQTFCTDK